MNISELVRIGLPVYNGEQHLAMSLESLLNQTHNNIEIFVVDNASTDGTKEIVQRISRKDSRIKYLRFDNWVNATENWNRTYEIAASGTRFFMWASDDDIVAEEYIESLLPLFWKIQVWFCRFHRPT